MNEKVREFFQLILTWKQIESLPFIMAF